MRRQEIGLDAYPYIASSTVLRTQRIEDALKVMITWSKPRPEQAGRELADIARDWGVERARRGGPVAAGRRDLLDDGRGRRAPRAELSTRR